MSMRDAFGSPGLDPCWAPSAKDGIGTANVKHAMVWFTLSQGIVTEVYFPHVDTPNTRDLQYLVTDGATFCHEERRDLIHQLEYPEPSIPFYRLINAEPAGRYRLIKEILVDPSSSVLLIHTRLEIADPELRHRLRVYALLAPHVAGAGRDNSAECLGVGGRAFVHAWHKHVHLVLGCAPDFCQRSVGYVGASDGWRDLTDNFRMDWHFTRALHGNLAVLAELDLAQGPEHTLGLGFGFSRQAAGTQLLQSFVTPFAEQRASYVAQWQGLMAHDELAAQVGDRAKSVRLSRNLLHCHEDKLFPGAYVASLTIPWGEARDDEDRGGYHLVWTRDMVHTATALLACGETDSPLRALIWLSSVQREDGLLPQNSTVQGEPFWRGRQLDEVAEPVLLAWRLQRAGKLGRFDPWTLVSRAARYLVLHGPVTAQERWEENSGYSPSTIATIIAALVCAADLCREPDKGTATFLLDYADWLVDNVDAWTATTCGEVVPGIRRHYLRITPADADEPTDAPSPDTAMLRLANTEHDVPARTVVSGDFLHLVRLGIRDAHDPLVVDSVAVIDQTLKRELPQGPCWRRYTCDAYGQKPDGGPFDGRGEGRSWPLLTGERGHYELAAGRNAQRYIVALERFANAGGMLAEQLWDAPDLPDGSMVFGGPTGGAMPLCWAHAEYLSLVRSHRDGVCFDRPEPVFRRYVIDKTPSRLTMWTPHHRTARMPAGRTLRIITQEQARVRWTTRDDWQSVRESETSPTTLGCHFVDLPTDGLDPGTRVLFTLLWQRGWEGRDYAVTVQ